MILCAVRHNNSALLATLCFSCTAAQLDEFRTEIQRRDQEILAMSAKMKTLEEQHQDYQRHIAVLKESLCAKEEHYNMLQADVSTEWCKGHKGCCVYVERVIV
jgi:chromosome segregation ATPase